MVPPARQPAATRNTPNVETAGRRRQRGQTPRCRIECEEPGRHAVEGRAGGRLIERRVPTVESEVRRCKRKAALRTYCPQPRLRSRSGSNERRPRAEYVREPAGRG